MDFNGKVVLVTGASSGIGAAIAIKFSSHGAKVAIVGRNEEKLQNIAEKIKAIHKNNEKPDEPFLLVINADVTKDDNVRRMVQDTVERFGKLDILVNNAGVAGLQSILSNNVMEFFDKIMSTNLHPAVYITNQAAPHIIKSKGNIINISSVASKALRHPKNFSYCTSKAGLDQFTKAIAYELSEYGVRVNAINPGPVITDIMDNAGTSKEEQEKYKVLLANTTALGRMSESDEVADLAMFLASDMARSITGVAYLMDNGVMLKAGGV